MRESLKVTPDHVRRGAFVYVRQSTTAQVEHHRESTDRQYKLVDRAVDLGWARDHVTVIDHDLGVSGAGLAERSGFAHLTAQVALGHVGLVLGLEVSRLARNNADWYRLLDLCGVTDTLIGDADGIYHPGLFNDRPRCRKPNCMCCALGSMWWHPQQSGAGRTASRPARRLRLG
jgi:hypothetical protein